MKMARITGGFTLVELMISIAVLSLLGGVNVALLSSTLDSFEHAQRRLDLQRVSAEATNLILEGGFEGQGLKGAVELKIARPNRIGFVPLWVDRSHVADPLRNKAQRFLLEKQFKAGAVVPIGQVKFPGTDEWVNAPVFFDPGAGRDPKRPDDAVTFVKPMPNGAEVRVLYTPDAEIHPETVMQIWFDPKTQEIFRSYKGVTAPLLTRRRGVTIERMDFMYYNNFNQPFPQEEIRSPSELRRITGVKVSVLLSRDTEKKELTSFTNVRNVQTIGVTISGGVSLPLPSPQTIRAWSLGDLSDLKGEGIVELEVLVEGRARWKMRLEFKQADNPSEVILHRFQIESPPGTQRTSGILDETVQQNQFVNLLTLDRSGRFDYDDDPDIDDAVNLAGEKNVVEVTRCDFEIAALFIRP